MDIITFMEQFYLHDSFIENIGYKFFKDQLVITVNFCNWAQLNFKEGDPENIIGNFIFTGVKELEMNTNFFDFADNEIDNVKHEQIKDDLDKITFVLRVPEPDVITILSFKAKQVTWEPFCKYFEKRVYTYEG